MISSKPPLLGNLEGTMAWVLRVVRRGLRNPEFEIKWQFWNIRDRMFVHKVVKQGMVYYQYKGDLYPEYLNRGNNAAYIYQTARIYCQGRGLDIGAGKWCIQGAIPIDNLADQNAYKLDNFDDNSLDYVFSSHCLEHLDRWKNALFLWIEKLRVGGTLFLYLPHKYMRMWRPGGPWARHNHVWIPTVEEINPFLLGSGMKVCDYNPGRDRYGGFHIVAQRIVKK